MAEGKVWRRYEGVDVPGGAAYGFDVSDTPSVDAMWAHVHSSFRAGQHHTSLIRCTTTDHQKTAQRIQCTRRHCLWSDYLRSPTQYYHF